MNRQGNRNTGFVEGGLSNLRNEIEAEARRIVEENYADEWNSSGLRMRWKLQKRIDQEVAELAVQMMPDVSSEALF